MTFHEDIITGAHAELDALLGTAIPASMDHVERVRLKRPPQIYWTPLDGQIGPAHTAGGENPAIINTDSQEWTCTIWQDTVANCRATLHNLIHATRKRWGGMSGKWWGTYSWSKPADSKYGVCQIVKVKLGVTVDGKIQQTTDPDETLEFIGEGQLIKTFDPLVVEVVVPSDTPVP